MMEGGGLTKQQWREVRAWLSLRPWQRHSLVLMVGGLVYIAIGVALLQLDEISPRRAAALAVALRMADLDIWALCFIAAGLLACASSRWPVFSESWGYAVLCGLSSAWSAVYITGYIFSLSPRTNITLGLVWLLVTFLWWGISGLVNPSRRDVEAADYGPS